jgi:hypothetical protein
MHTQDTVKLGSWFLDDITFVKRLVLRHMVNLPDL